MTYYIKNGTNVRLHREDSIDLHHTLPVGTYIVKRDPFEALYLESVDNFVAPTKEYGELPARVKRIYSTFEQRTTSTGVLLVGEKGSGKSQLARSLAIRARQDGYSTIIVSTPIVGDDFYAFIQAISEPAVVIFDEFEKVYNSEQQEKLLTLFDGVFPQKKMFVVTANNRYKLNEHLTNRPGRMYYYISYEGLSEAFITEYAMDNLKNQDEIPGLLRTTSAFGEFNFDMLQAIVEEMNRYNETAAEAMSYINARPESNGRDEFEVVMKLNGVVVDSTLHDRTIRANPFAESFSVEYRECVITKDSSDTDWLGTTFNVANLKSFGGDTYVFSRDNFEVELTRKRPPKFAFSAF